MPIDIDRFVEDIVIYGAKENLTTSGNLMPCFFMFGDKNGNEVGMMPVLGDLGKPGAKQELVLKLRKVKDEQEFHTVVFLSDSYIRSYETKSWKDAMAEREQGPDSLKEDPKATEALIIVRLTAKGGDTTVINYKRCDDGAYVFEEPTVKTDIYSSWMTRIWDVN